MCFVMVKLITMMNSIYNAILAVTHGFARVTLSGGFMFLSRLRLTSNTTPAVCAPGRCQKSTAKYWINSGYLDN